MHSTMLDLLVSVACTQSDMVEGPSLILLNLLYVLSLSFIPILIVTSLLHSTHLFYCLLLFFFSENTIIPFPFTFQSHSISINLFIGVYGILLLQLARLHSTSHSSSSFFCGHPFLHSKRVHF